MVDIPAEKMSEKCTIQVKQWAEDFDWYYYACVDVEIVLELDGTADIDKGLPPDQCVWEPADSRTRANIRRSILIFSVVLFDVVLFLVWIYRCQVTTY
jgi:hypothetical protein